MIDYTGKLNTKKEYIEVLGRLKEECKYIEIVILDGRKSNELIDKFHKDIIYTKKVSKWWGTEINGSNYLYGINNSNKLFEYLNKFETFCKYYEYGSNSESFKRGDYSETTDFGIDDIAFYDENNDLLLCTTTHEGYIMINEKLLNTK